MEPKFCMACGRALRTQRTYKWDAYTGEQSIRYEWLECPVFGTFHGHDSVDIVAEPASESPKEN